MEFLFTFSVSHQNVLYVSLNWDFAVLSAFPSAENIYKADFSFFLFETCIVYIQLNVLIRVQRRKFSKLWWSAQNQFVCNPRNCEPEI